MQTESNQKFDPHAILGVTPECDFFEVRAAYHRMCRAFHEDKLHHYGLHPDLIRFATSRMQEINVAYLAIKETLADEPHDVASESDLGSESESFDQNLSLLMKVID